MNNTKLVDVKLWPFLVFHSFFTDFSRQNMEASVNVISVFAKKKSQRTSETF